MTIREKFIQGYANKVVFPIYKFVFRSFKAPFSMEQLQQMPEGTLGKDLHHFLKVNKLDILPLLHAHDVKHILLGYDTSLEDEVCLQFFDLGNRFYTLQAIVSSAAFIVILPESWAKFKEAFKRGRAAKPIGRLHFEKMLHISTQELRITNHLNSSAYEN